MKVCTDACILGAWFAGKPFSDSNVLDIGSGTGLLMMMLAQKSKATIHGIELSLSCFKQLKENIAQNQWGERLTVYHGDVRSYSFPEKYDFIIANPPFYENDLQSGTSEKNLAKHSGELSLKELVQVIQRNLSIKGSFGILLSYDRWEYFNGLSEEQGFYLREKLFIRHSPAHNFSRAVLRYSHSTEKSIPAHEISIHEGDTAGYSKEFIALMEDYYLYL